MNTKEVIRKEIWALLQKHKVARFPGAEGRIPNFIGAEACAKQLAETTYWKAAKVLKINPDSPQRAIRHRALAEGKIIYMAVPRLRSDKPFIELDPKKLKCSPYVASSIKGAGQHGQPIGIAKLRTVDLVVCGSVAVNRRGARVGKGGGYSDLEFALLTEQKKIAANTPIVTSIHPLQMIDGEIPMTEHDIPLSAIVTPDEVIEIKSKFPRPKGIYWNLLPQEKIADIPVLHKRSG
ncbi:MAG: 5-formyltetrahydrofolate cyclo-ligase [Deltaproteobacteria bacterium]|jgi:5-formyltetrahydrofolate cyclo-ligase|nr:MAG: 5-formyltetrahydrofolate cyclo-ligase [Deltaproteobacteria bacterium]